jgi:hypothetical protein
MMAESVTDGGIAVAEWGEEADGKVAGPNPQTRVRSVDIAAMLTYFMWPIILLRDRGVLPLVFGTKYIIRVEYFLRFI